MNRAVSDAHHVYASLFVHEEQSFERSLWKIAARYDVEINWECFETAMEHLFVSTLAPVPTTDYSLLESLITVMIRECEFMREIGIENHVEQIAWELLQFAGYPLFAGYNTILYNDVVPTLEHLQNVGFKLAIVSNWDTPLDPLTERLGIAVYFDAIIASHDARVRSENSNPHIFNYPLTAVGVSAEEVVHVGDAYEADIVGAQGVGVRPILLDREGSQLSRWDETIRSLVELPELLNSERQRK